MENDEQDEKEVGKVGDTITEAGGSTSADGSSAQEAEAGQDLFKKIQDELSEARDKYIRLYAEFDNHRRRTAKEKLEMIQGANEHLIKALLPVMDDFERAEKAFKEKNDKESEGLLLIQNKFRKVLDQFGVKPMEVKGDFNPDLHEAITQVPGETGKKGQIVDVIEKGYLLNDKVIRFAKVVVSM